MSLVLRTLIAPNVSCSAHSTANNDDPHSRVFVVFCVIRGRQYDERGGEHNRARRAATNVPMLFGIIGGINRCAPHICARNGNSSHTAGKSTSVCVCLCIYTGWAAAAVTFKRNGHNATRISIYMARACL